VTAAERLQLQDAVAQLRKSLAYRTGATNVRQPTNRIADLIARSTSSTTPPVPTAPVRVKGAIVITAGNANPDLLRQAGITHVAVEHNLDNARDAATARWAGFTMGWFIVSRGNDGDTLAFKAPLDSKFLVVDTEAHKADMGGQLAWTETLYATLRSRFGQTCTLYNITFGIHSSPAVVNHEALRKHNVKALWETYGGLGETLGVSATVAKAHLEGWNPAHVCLGDKNLPAEVAEVRALSGVGDVFCWAPEQAGLDVLELAKVSVT
jgi:hypothetical protein